MFLSNKAIAELTTAIESVCKDNSIDEYQAKRLSTELFAFVIDEITIITSTDNEAAKVILDKRVENCKNLLDQIEHDNE